jgi:AraC-like DNA-binding protein
VVHVHVSARENEFMQRMRSIIEEHINDPQFNMNMLSKHMTISHSQLHRRITALTGESVGKFVRSVRLTKAVELLCNSELTISEIAHETGFSEPGYFTKIFSKEFNMTPSEFRGSLTGYGYKGGGPCL